MESTKMLKLANELAAYICKDQTEKTAYDLFFTPGRAYVSGAGANIAALVEALEDNIRAESARSAHRGGALAAAKRILKNSPRDDLKGAIMRESGQILCDGYRAVVLQDYLPLPESASDFHAENFVESAARDATEPLDLPSIADLRAHIKIEKAQTGQWKRTPVLYDFGPGMPLVNAQFLLDMLQVLPGCTAMIYPGTRGLSNPIYFLAPSGEGILLPVWRK